MDSERIPCSLLQGQASEYIKEKFKSSKGVIAMKKMMPPTFFAFTPANGPYAADKVMLAESVEDDSAVEVACRGLHGFMKTDLVVTR